MAQVRGGGLEGDRVAEAAGGLDGVGRVGGGQRGAHRDAVPGEQVLGRPPRPGSCRGGRGPVPSRRSISAAAPASSMSSYSPTLPGSAASPAPAGVADGLGQGADGPLGGGVGGNAGGLARRGRRVAGSRWRLWPPVPGPGCGAAADGRPAPSDTPDAAGFLPRGLDPCGAGRPLFTAGRCRRRRQGLGQAADFHVHHRHRLRRGRRRGFAQGVRQDLAVAGLHALRSRRPRGSPSPPPRRTSSSARAAAEGRAEVGRGRARRQVEGLERAQALGQTGVVGRGGRAIRSCRGSPRAGPRAAAGRRGAGPRRRVR